ncbi:MAG: hypothetical protein Q8Q26_17315 [Pseudorhodobacter sp.]|nr:hypothetical protein [Pseudorhodobacter sp.]
MSENAKDTLVLGMMTTGTCRTGFALFDQDGRLVPGQLQDKIVVQDGPKGYLAVTQTFRVPMNITMHDEHSNG